jgi:hypothetical protein
MGKQQNTLHAIKMLRRYMFEIARAGAARVEIRSDLNATLSDSRGPEVLAAELLVSGHSVSIHGWDEAGEHRWQHNY